MLDISPILFLSVGVIFLIVLAILNSMLFKPLLKHMDDRTAQIKKDLEDAKSNGTNVDDLLESANNIIAQAKREAAKIREQAYLQASQEANVKLEDAKTSLETQYRDFTSDLQLQKESLEKSLIEQMPSFKESLKSKIGSI